MIYNIPVFVGCGACQWLVSFGWRKAFYIIVSHNFSLSPMVSTTLVFSLGYCTFLWHGLQDVAVFRGVIFTVGWSLCTITVVCNFGLNQPTDIWLCFCGHPYKLYKGPLRLAVLLHQCFTYSSLYLENIWGPLCTFPFPPFPLNWGPLSTLTGTTPS